MNKTQMFKKTTWLAVCLTALLAGCSRENENTKAAEIYPQDYRCTGAQLVLVKKEFEICQESGFFDSHCFKMAKSSQCELIVDLESNNTDS